MLKQVKEYAECTDTLHRAYKLFLISSMHSCQLLLFGDRHRAA